MATELFPIVTTADLPRSLAFYRDLLGGTVTYEFPGPDGAPEYVALVVGSGHLGIGVAPDFAPPEGRRAISLWVYVPSCDALVTDLRAAGVEIVEGPVDQPWGERVARVRDPDGNAVFIGQHPAGG